MFVEKLLAASIFLSIFWHGFVAFEKCYRTIVKPERHTFGIGTFSQLITLIITTFLHTWWKAAYMNSYGSIFLIYDHIPNCSAWKVLSNHANISSTSHLFMRWKLWLPLTIRFYVDATVTDWFYWLSHWKAKLLSTECTKNIVYKSSRQVTS